MSIPEEPPTHCGKEMVLRVNRKNGSQFFGCWRFPQCRYTEPYESPFEDDDYGIFHDDIGDK